jgi:hypothetical protein
MVEKETKTYRFDKEVIEHAERNLLIPSFAEWACERYRQEFLSVTSIAQKHQEAVIHANYLKSELLRVKQVEDSIHTGNLTKAELQWIQKEGVTAVKKATFEGVYKRFVTTFSRPDILRKQFKKIIEYYDEKTGEI